MFYSFMLLLLMMVLNVTLNKQNIKILTFSKFSWIFMVFHESIMKNYSLKIFDNCKWKITLSIWMWLQHSKQNCADFFLLYGTKETLGHSCTDFRHLYTLWDTCIRRSMGIKPGKFSKIFFWVLKKCIFW